MMNLTRAQLEANLQEYENLLTVTIRKWRDAITYDFNDDDIRQELRLKVWRALEQFDPEKWPGNMPVKDKERRHVFGAVLNRVKDLTDKKKREQELLVDDIKDYRQVVNVQIKQADNGVSSHHVTDNGNQTRFIMEHCDVGENHHALIGLSEDQIYIAISLNDGYSRKEIVEAMKITDTQFKRELTVIQLHVDEYRKS